MPPRKASPAADSAWPARALVAQLGTECSAFTLRKLERGDLYVTRRRVALDASGKPCRRAALTRDGMILQAGMAAQGYVGADGTWVPQKALTGVGPDGASLPLAPGTLGTPQPVEEASPEALLDLHVSAVYRLAPVEGSGELLAKLQAGHVFRLAFNYRSDFRSETAFLVANAEGMFAVVGVPAPPTWLAPDAAPPVEADAAGAPDDLDFDMLGGLT